MVKGNIKITPSYEYKLCHLKPMTLKGIAFFLTSVSAYINHINLMQSCKIR